MDQINTVYTPESIALMLAIISTFYLGHFGIVLIYSKRDKKEVFANIETRILTYGIIMVLFMFPLAVSLTVDVSNGLFVQSSSAASILHKIIMSMACTLITIEISMLVIRARFAGLWMLLIGSTFILDIIALILLIQLGAHGVMEAVGGGLGVAITMTTLGVFMLFSSLFTIVACSVAVPAQAGDLGNYFRSRPRAEGEPEDVTQDAASEPANKPDGNLE